MKGKKLAALLLSLAMVITMMPSMAYVAYADAVIIEGDTYLEDIRRFPRALKRN